MLGDSLFIGHVTVAVRDLLAAAAVNTQWLIGDVGTLQQVPEAWFPLAGRPSSELCLGLALQPPPILDSVESPMGLLSQWIKRVDSAAPTDTAIVPSGSASGSGGSEGAGGGLERDSLPLARAVIFLHNALKCRFMAEADSDPRAVDAQREVQESLDKFMQVRVREM